MFNVICVHFNMLIYLAIIYYIDDHTGILYNKTRLYVLTNVILNLRTYFRDGLYSDIPVQCIMHKSFKATK